MPFDVFRKQMDVLFTCSQFQGLALHKCQNGVPENASWSWTPAELGGLGVFVPLCWCSIFALFAPKYAVVWILAGYEKQERQEGVNNYAKNGRININMWHQQEGLSNAIEWAKPKQWNT